MKQLIQKVSVFAAAFFFSLLLAIPAFADEIMIVPEGSSFLQGKSFTVNVSISGKEIYAYELHVSGSDNLIGGGDFADTADGSESVVVSATFTAFGTGTSTIYAGGSYSDGKKLYEVGSESLTITIESSSETASGSGNGNGRAADTDENYRQADGSYINNREPEINPENTQISSGEAENPETEEQSENIVQNESRPEPSAAAPAARTKKSGLAWILAGTAILLVLAACILSLVLIRKQRKQTGPETDGDEETDK